MFAEDGHLKHTMGKIGLLCNSSVTAAGRFGQCFGEVQCSP